MKIVRDAALEAFAIEVSRPEDQIDLARAALVMGQFAYPSLNVQAYIERIDRLADAARRALREGKPPALVLAEFLFETLGFAGNTTHYEDPRNSFLNEVLERRLGIPISLSVLYLEVARRAGVQAQGVGLPGHFIVRVVLDTGEVIYLDPFHRGMVLSEEDCRARVRAVTGGKLPFHPSFLNPVGQRYILTRMLNNLKNHYAQRGDLVNAARVVERLLVLDPDNWLEVRNLGLIYGQIGRKHQAIALLEQYLNANPSAPDTAQVRDYLDALVAQVSRVN